MRNETRKKIEGTRRRKGKERKERRNKARKRMERTGREKKILKGILLLLMSSEY